MSIPAAKWFVTAFLAGACWGQQSPELSARELYYRERPDDGPPPSVKSSNKPQARQSPPGNDSNAATHKGTSAAKPSTGTHEAGSPGNGGIQLAAEKVPVPAGHYLGLRYNLLLIDSKNGEATPADSAQVFRSGECVALEFEANRSGYLYVLEQGSSGAWNPLLPSAEMPDEANILKARTSKRVPEKHCYEIASPAGQERIFVVLSRNPEDLHQLHEAIKNDSGLADAQGQLAKNVIADEVKRLQAGLQDRDLKVKKIEQPEAAGEPPDSVYVVNASDSSADRVVTEIRIQHQ